MKPAVNWPYIVITANGSMEYWDLAAARIACQDALKMGVSVRLMHEGLGVK